MMAPSVTEREAGVAAVSLREQGANSVRTDAGFRIRSQSGTEKRRLTATGKGVAKLMVAENPRDRVTIIVDLLRDQMHRRPYVTLAVALGVGFAMGGGLSTRLGRAALFAALRSAGREWIKAAL